MRKINKKEDVTIYNQNTQTAPSDISYSFLGNELLSETVIGRLSPGDNITYTDFSGNIITTNELTNEEKQTNILNQINKIIEYEKINNKIILENTIDDDYYSKVLGIAGNEGGDDYVFENQGVSYTLGIDGLSDNEFMRNELTKLANIGCVCKELYDSNSNTGHLVTPFDKLSNITYDNIGNPTYINLIEEINNGISLLLYIGHSSEYAFQTTNFNILNIENLNNINKYFLLSAVGCSLGSHDENYLSLAESFMTPEKSGCIACFGSSILQSWEPPMYQQRKLVEIIVNSIKNKEIKTIGELFFESITTANNKWVDSEDIWFYHLFGDPETIFVMTIPNLIK